MQASFPKVVIIALVASLFSCARNTNNNDLHGYVQKSVLLSNSLGLVSVYLPAELDTFYTAVNYGEYHCAELKLHRFASRKYTCCLSTNSDFLYNDLSDSLYQFTIIQTFNPDCEEYVTINADLENSIKNYYMSLDKEAALQRKYYMRNINGRVFLLSELSLKIDSLQLRELDGFTDADGRLIKFIYKCYCKNPGDFIERMMRSMKTIQIIEEGKAVPVS